MHNYNYSWNYQYCIITNGTSIIIVIEYILIIQMRLKCSCGEFVKIFHLPKWIYWEVGLSKMHSVRFMGWMKKGSSASCGVVHHHKMFGVVVHQNRQNALMRGSFFFHVVEITISLDEFRRINEKEHEVQGPLQVDNPVLWTKPFASMFKINWNVVVNKGLRQIARNWTYRTWPWEYSVIVSHSLTHKKMLVEHLRF